MRKTNLQQKIIFYARNIEMASRKIQVKIDDLNPLNEEASREIVDLLISINDASMEAESAMHRSTNLPSEFVKQRKEELEG